MKALYVYIVRHAESSNNYKDLDDLQAEAAAVVAARAATPPQLSSANGSCREESGDSPAKRHRGATAPEANGASNGSAAGATAAPGVANGVAHSVSANSAAAPSANGDAAASNGSAANGGVVVNGVPAAGAPRPVRQRASDPVLTPRGHAQAAATARFFRRLLDDQATEPRLRPRRIFVSGFTRTLQTCRPIAEELGLRPELQLDLHEEGGVFDGPRRNRTGEYPVRHGLNSEQMRHLLPDLQGAEGVTSQGWWRGGVETLEESAARARRSVAWLWDLAEQQDAGAESGAIICVSHGLYADRLVKALMGMDPTLGSVVLMTANCGYWLIGLHLDPAAVHPRQTVLAACNVVDHIPSIIRTGHKIGPYSHCQPSYPDREGAEGAQRQAVANL